MYGIESPEGEVVPGVVLTKNRRVFKRDLSYWEVRHNGELIGHIEPTRIGRSSSTFYEAVGYYPGTGVHVSLELSTDLAERCTTLIEFQRSPQSSVHLPWHLRQR